VPSALLFGGGGGAGLVFRLGGGGGGAFLFCKLVTFPLTLAPNPFELPPSQLVFLLKDDPYEPAPVTLVAGELLRSFSQNLSGLLEIASSVGSPKTSLADACRGLTVRSAVGCLKRDAESAVILRDKFGRGDETDSAVVVRLSALRGFQSNPGNSLPGDEALEFA